MTSRIDGQSICGLRELKKAKTRVAIQKHAIRLVRERGYSRTTVEQIARAACVSPSTFFRYFRTKEDAVMYGTLDALIIRAFADQPSHLAPVRALANACRQATAQLSAKKIGEIRDQMALVLETPELRERMLDGVIRGSRVFTRSLAKRMGCPADDFEVRICAGAMIGVVMAARIAFAQDPDADLASVLDKGLSMLESGLPSHY